MKKAIARFVRQFFFTCVPTQGQCGLKKKYGFFSFYYIQYSKMLFIFRTISQFLPQLGGRTFFQFLCRYFCHRQQQPQPKQQNNHNCSWVVVTAQQQPRLQQQNNHNCSWVETKQSLGIPPKPPTPPPPPPSPPSPQTQNYMIEAK